MRRLIAGLAILAAACGGGEAATTTTTPPSLTSVPPVTGVTTGAPSTTTTLVPPSLAEPPVFDRWTTILASLPVDEWDEETAREEAFEYVDAGAGLLFSDDYPSLNPGYWVVFSGDFATQEDAIAHCRSLREEEVSCYHRYLGEAPVIAAGRTEGSLVAWADGMLAVVDADTGDILEEVSGDYNEAIFPGSPELAADGTGVFFGMGFEDGWYSCESIAGRIDYVDLTSGEATEIAVGFGPRLSPDGTRLAYIATGECIPDPENESWVVGFYDTVAVFDLATGATQQWGPSPGIAATPESLITSLAWSADGSALFVAMDDGRLRVVDTAVGAALDATPTLGAGRVDVPFGAWVLAGVDAGSGNLVAIEQDYETARSRLIEISTTSGLVVNVAGWRDGYWAASFDAANGALLLTGDGILSGAPAGPLGPDPYFTGADW